MKKALVLCGANIGNRKEHIAAVSVQLKQSLKVEIIKQSAFYETDAWGETNQAAFYNRALWIETSLEPYELLKLVKDIEINLGRKRTRRWGPRLIDIDILYYEGLIVNIPELSIPHPEIQNRAFALIPASEIAPDWIDPRNGKSILELCNLCKDNLPVKKILD